MWTCQKCGEKHEDQFDSCWKCANPAKAKYLEHDPTASPLKCLRCQTAMKFDGTRRLEESHAMGGVVGVVIEYFVGLKSFDVYHCPACGKVEFFVNGIGEGKQRF